ncbi:MAG TPA: Gfo/Idh/MocA family oxidoreductase, partial [Tepidisphaeraceae bacterium]|nr:Gfo/Idh/MocA family oxidoreductase [Tepidisphaeraceae bacterium]
MAVHTIAHVGCGGRGRDHIRALATVRPALRLVGLCDQVPERLAEGRALAGGDVATYADAERMLAEERPDVFSFCTPPAIRRPLIELGVRHGVKAIVCEKPMALSLGEARSLVELT